MKSTGRELELILMTAVAFLISVVPAAASMEEALFAARNRNFEKAYELFLAEAELGNAEAQYRTASMLSSGSGVTKNDALAAHWFQKAAELGHPKAIKKLDRLNSTAHPINHPEDKLLKASRNGDIEAISQLIDAGVNVNHQDKFGTTPLMEAVRSNQNAAVKYLLDQDADPNLQNNVSDTALMIATTLNNTENVQMILEHGGDVNILDKNSSSPLIIAVARENIKAVRLLTQKGADLFFRNTEGKSAYDIAMGSKNEVLITMIRKAGGEKLAMQIKTKKEDQKKQLLSSKPENQRNWSPLMYGVWRGDVMAVKTALNSSTDLEQKDTSGMTALSLAARGGHAAIIEILLSAGAKVDCSPSDVNPLLLSIKSDSPLSVKALISPIIKKPECKSFLENMLNQSLAMERLEIAELFFKNDITINNQSGISPLITMASKLDDEIINSLIANGADVNATDEHGLTALMIASKSGNQKAVKNLLENKADIELKDDFGRTALVHSVLNNQTSISKYLIEGGANVFSLTDENNSALMLAAENGFSSIVEILVPFKNLDQKNNVGDTALIMAVRGRHFKVADTLLKNGANPRISNKRKEKALTVVHAEDRELYALIEEYSSSRSWIRDIF